MALEFSPETLKEFEATVARYPKKDAAMLPVLYLAQSEFGHLSAEEGLGRDAEDPRRGRADIAQRAVRGDDQGDVGCPLNQ